MSTRRTRGLALVVLSFAFVSACGLKPEVKDQLSQGTLPGAGSVDGLGGGGTTGGVDGGGATGGGGTTGGTTGIGGTSGGSATGGSTGGTGGTSGGSTGGSGSTGSTGSTGGTTGGSTTGGAGVVMPGDNGSTVGIDMARKVVKIALHGPLTGAGVPQESFRTGTPKYWQNRKLANGFTVEAEAIDDEYNAQDAARACAAAASKFFLIVGGAGTDQIQACAQQQKVRAGGVPYLSAGVTENGLGALPNYFATSLTYRQQGKMVVQMAKDNGFAGGKWGVVITEGPNFADARQGIAEALKAAGENFNPAESTSGGNVHLTAKAPRDCSGVGPQVAAQNYKAIYFLGQPSFFAQCVGVIGPNPVYTGVGPSFGINTVANLACTAARGGYKGFYLHPASGLDQAAKRAPGVSFQDDIEYQIYGAMQGLEKAFNLVQGKLTREKFIAALAAAQIPDGISPGATYAGGSRFGGKAAFALKASCGGTPQTNRYNTLKLYSK